MAAAGLLCESPDVFDPDETHVAFESAVRAWCERALAGEVPALERGEKLPYPLLRALGRELGLAEVLGATAERKLAKLRGGAETRSLREGGGDLAGDPLLTSILFKEIGRVSPGFAMVLMATLGCGMTILARGSAELVERFAIPILRFEKIGAWALTEPEAGSDAFGGMRTTAVREADGWRLRGQKTFISNAPYADVIAVFARVARESGEPLARPIVVERGTAGLEVGPPLRKMGMHDSPTGDVFLDDCRVPLGHLVGALESESRARGAAALDTLNMERAVMPSICLGILERCVEESVRHARTRRQFGRTIGEFQAVAFTIARMEVALENARNLVTKLAHAQKQGRLDARLASIAKLYCAEEATRAALAAVQVHGGSGYMADLPLEKLARDAKMFEIGGGTNEIQLQTIARALLA
ncbi:butyryl-CoA dehydrogenase [Myxococcaceae bacterium]|nr:butyryl-CoA dehydrogenase [Myxococcaceae bacterium]